MRPHTSYVVCATQRSGSFLLLEALTQTGVAGNPEEYFLCDDAPDSWEGGEWARAGGVASRADFLRLVLARGTSANGVFGVKIMWNYFREMIERLRETLPDEGLDACDVMRAVFPNVHYIWLVRRDRVRQAVSWSKAAQTGSYASHTPPAREAVFDFAQVDNMLQSIIEGEEGWRRFFAGCGIRPFKVVYEDFVAEYEQTTIRILEYLRIPAPPPLVFGRRELQRQSDALNEEWVQKYLQIKRWVSY